MQARSLNSSLLTQARLEQQALIDGLTSRQRVLVLLINAIPILHAGACLATAIFTPASWWFRLIATSVILYLLPPLAVRALFALARIRKGNLAVGSKDFFLWWTSFQWQMLFCRFPALEEILRLVPGLYSAWLRLWGSTIGRYAFWAPGTLILDRSFLKIGDDVVFGVGVRLNAHVGDICQIGGYSLLTAGTKVEQDQATKAFLLSPPLSTWRNGKRVREPGGAGGSVESANHPRRKT